MTTARPPAYVDQYNQNLTILIICFAVAFHLAVIVVVVYLSCRKRTIQINIHTTDSRSQERASLSRTDSLASRRDSLADTSPDEDVADERPVTNWRISLITRVSDLMRPERRSRRRPPHGTPPPVYEQHVSDDDQACARGYEDSLPPNYEDCVRGLPGYYITETGDLAVDKPPAYEDIA